LIESVSLLGQRIAENIERVIVGKHEPVRLTLWGFCPRATFIEDVPDGEDRAG
jgi:hypothetical protein